MIFYFICYKKNSYFNKLLKYSSTFKYWIPSITLFPSNIKHSFLKQHLISAQYQNIFYVHQMLELTDEYLSTIFNLKILQFKH